MTTIANALKAWEKQHEKAAEGATDINLCFQQPPISKLDSKTLGGLKSCEKLSLSTNMIDRMVPLAGLNKLKILSLGR